MTFEYTLNGQRLYNVLHNDSDRLFEPACINVVASCCHLKDRIMKPHRSRTQCYDPPTLQYHVMQLSATGNQTTQPHLILISAHVWIT